MGVPFGLNQSAGHVAVCVIATIAVGMALGFRLSAGKHRFAFCIAGGIVGMTLGLSQCAGLLAPPIAAVGVGMSILAADQLGLHRHSGQRGLAEQAGAHEEGQKLCRHPPAGFVLVVHNYFLSLPFIRMQRYPAAGLTYAFRHLAP